MTAANSNAGQRIDVVLRDTTGNAQVVTGQNNTVTLVLTNNGPTDIPIGPSTPSPQPPPNDFGMVLSFAAFYATGDAQSALSVTASGWSAQFFPDDAFPGWGLAASEATVWKVGQSLTFTITQFTPTVSPGMAQLSVDIFDPSNPPDIPLYLPVSVVATPSGQALWTTVLVSIKDDEVAVSKTADQMIANSLVLQVANSNPGAPVIPDTQPWGANPPQLTLSFVYAGAAPGYYALTTPTLADAIDVGIRQSGLSGLWNAPVKRDGPSWVFTPTAQNHGVIGTGTRNIVEITIDNLMTQLAAGPTLLYLQLANFPGYADTCFTVFLQKHYRPMAINSFSINTDTFHVDGETPATGYLTWNVENAVMVQLEGYGEVPAKQQSFPVTIEATSTFVLTAFDPILGNLASSSRKATVRPGLLLRQVPSGTILLWTGSAATIPSGYVLCNGLHGTPNLTGQFVAGASDQIAVGVKDGTHTHSVNILPGSGTMDTVGAYPHGMPTFWYARSFTSGSKSAIDTSGTYDKNSTFPADESHTHTASVTLPAWTSGASTYRPPWYALCYIMKAYG